MSELRIVQYFNYTSKTGTLHRYQNYFIGENRSYGGNTYAFAPFQASGSLSSLNGDNETVQVLFPATEYAIRIVDGANGNRQSTLELTTMWLTGDNSNSNVFFTEHLVGIGASFDDTTLELRFRTAMDSVGAGFPARTFTRDNVGVLPINAELYLR